MRTSRIGIIAFFVALTIIFYWQYNYYRSSYDASEAVDTTVEGVSETDGLRHSISLEDIVIGNPQKDGIPSIDDPSFESVLAADQYLDDNGYGLMLEVNGDVRFYPYQILVWHEIVNDTFNGETLAVTYCPLCFTGVAYDRTLNSVTYDFGVSGKLYDNNLLMYDRQTETYWSQALGEAVVGELTGAELDRYPSLTMTWKNFRINYPNGEVLSRKTGFSRDYTSDPYGPEGYYTNADIWFPLSVMDDRLFSKEIVFGYQNEFGTKAYPFTELQDRLLINDEVGGEPIVVFWDPDLGAVRAFSRYLADGQVTEFDFVDDFLQDSIGGSFWTFDGVAITGALAEATLEPLILEQAFWFSWVASHPETEVLTTNN